MSFEIFLCPSQTVQQNTETTKRMIYKFLLKSIYLITFLLCTFLPCQDSQNCILNRRSHTRQNYGWMVMKATKSITNDSSFEPRCLRGTISFCFQLQSQFQLIIPLSRVHSETKNFEMNKDQTSEMGK